MGRTRKTILEIEAAEEANKKNLSDKEGTIGYLIKNHIEEIDKLKTTGEIIAYCEDLINKSEDRVKDKQAFMHYLKKKQTVEDMLIYIWDYWFAGDNLRAIRLTYLKDCKKGIY